MSKSRLNRAQIVAPAKLLNTGGHEAITTSDGLLSRPAFPSSSSSPCRLLCADQLDNATTFETTPRCRRPWTSEARAAPTELGTRRHSREQLEGPDRGHNQRKTATSHLKNGDDEDLRLGSMPRTFASSAKGRKERPALRAGQNPFFYLS